MWRETYDYAADHFGEWFPVLPSYQSYNRRLNRLDAVFAPFAEAALSQVDCAHAQQEAVRIAGSMPIMLAKEKRSSRAKVALELTNKGYCSSKGTFYYGVKLHAVAERQLMWFVGLNPFAKSLMQGEGANASNYHAYSGYVVGALPVGIRSKDRYTPYWPTSVTWRFREIWTHPVGLMLWGIADQWPGLGGQHRPKAQLTRSGQGSDFTIRAQWPEVDADAVELRTFNLKIEGTPTQQTGAADGAEWSVRRQNPGKPWAAVVLLDGQPVGDLTGAIP